jgi:hypothetical protein
MRFAIHQRRSPATRAMAVVAFAVALSFVFQFSASPARADSPPISIDLAPRAILAPDFTGASGAVLTFTITCPEVYDWTDGGFIITQQRGDMTAEAWGFHKFQTNEVICDGAPHVYEKPTNSLQSGTLRPGPADVLVVMSAMTLGTASGTTVSFQQRVLLLPAATSTNAA